MLRDFRFALRTLWKSPGFAVTTILSIALGIGANATVFSLADGVLLRPLPVPVPSQVVVLRSVTPSGALGSISYRDYQDYRDNNRSFSGMVAYQLSSFGFARKAGDQPQLRMGFFVSGNFFQVLGVAPELGRAFLPGEGEIPGRDPVIVLGHDFWKTEFGSDRSVIGQTIRLSGNEFKVIGVSPESFTGMDQFIRPAFFLPAAMAPNTLPAEQNILTDRSLRGFTVKGRLKPGVLIQKADEEAAVIAKSLEQSYGTTNQSFGARVRTELQTRFDLNPYTPMLLSLLFAIVFLALLIACANVANLLLGRAQARKREIAVRLSLGANRWRLVRQLMVESLVVALAGGLTGLAIAFIGVRILSSIRVPGEIPIELSFQLDARVLGFTLLCSAVSAVLFGLVPSLQSTKTNLVTALKSGDAELARKRFFGRNALVSAQVAGAMIALVAATQLYRAFSSVAHRNPGFRTDHLITMSFDPAMVHYTPDQTEHFYKALSDRLRDAPGVKSAALSFSVPMTNEMLYKTVVPEGFQLQRGQESVNVLANIVDEHYFDTLRVPLLSGRGFLASDRKDSPLVAVVNQSFARHYLANDAVGKRMRLGGKDGPWVQVVGVAATGKYLSLIEPTTDFLYLPLSQNFQPRQTLTVEAYGNPTEFAGPLRELVRTMDSNLPIFGVRTMSDLFEQRALKELEVINEIVGSAGLVGLGLALIGLYAVVAYQVARRTREIGIRIAVGASQQRVVLMVLRHAARISAIGVSIGLLITLGISRALTVGLGLPAFNFTLLSLVLFGLLLTSLLAAAVPARKASRINPWLALRQD
jgi:predicted permease